MHYTLYPLYPYAESIWRSWGVLRGTEEYCWALQGTAGYYRVLQGTTGYWEILQGTAGYCRVLWGTVGHYKYCTPPVLPSTCSAIQYPRSYLPVPP